MEVRTGKAGPPIHVAGGSNGGIVITPDGKTAYTLGWMLTPVNLVTRKAGRPVPAMGQPLLSIAMSPDGATVYVSRNHAIVVVSTATNRQQRLIPTPPSECDYRIEFSL